MKNFSFLFPLALAGLSHLAANLPKHFMRTTLFCFAPLSWLGFIVALWPISALAQSVYEPYTFTTFARLTDTGGNKDGTGSATRFNFPIGVAIDSAGNIYVVDYGNKTIRMGWPADGTANVTPIITAHPVSQTVWAGTNVKLGVIADHYHLFETATSNYAGRTEKNMVFSPGRVIFSLGWPSGFQGVKSGRIGEINKI